MQIFGGVIEKIIYRKGLQRAVLSLGKGACNKFNIYLNPSIKPEFVKPGGKEILFVEGDFLSADASIFSPTLIVEWNEEGLVEHKLYF